MKRSRLRSMLFAGALGTALVAPAMAWGDLGHRVTAIIAYRRLTPHARQALDALLAIDDDALTARDFPSRATWADKYRTAHRETAAWHFIDIEIDNPDMQAACFGFPALGANQAASDGPAQDCILDKIDEFFAELKNPQTPAAEKLLALKFLIHFVGDLHQPLHAADHNDRGGNCVGLSSSPDGHSTNLHAYWDTGAVTALGGSADAIADKLDAGITMAQMQSWTAGTSRTWAMETYQIGAKDAYNLPARPTCGAPGAIELTSQYQAAAQADASLQLQKAAIRLAGLLNNALG